MKDLDNYVDIIDEADDKDEIITLSAKKKWPFAGDEKPDWYYEPVYEFNSEKRVNEELPAPIGVEKNRTIAFNSDLKKYAASKINKSIKSLWRSIKSDIENVVDKQLALNDIRGRKWPLSPELKPDWYHEYNDDANVKKLESTMQLNHYIKSYLSLLINKG